jgi:hypothetical protein
MRWKVISKAICQTIHGDWQTTELRDADRCAADISNEDGKLMCNRKQPGPPGTFLEAFAEGVPGLGQRGSPWPALQVANWQLRSPHPPVSSTKNAIQWKFGW